MTAYQTHLVKIPQGNLNQSQREPGSSQCFVAQNRARTVRGSGLDFMIKAVHHFLYA